MAFQTNSDREDLNLMRAIVLLDQAAAYLHDRDFRHAVQLSELAIMLLYASARRVRSDEHKMAIDKELRRARMITRQAIASLGLNGFF